MVSYATQTTTLAQARGQLNAAQEEARRLQEEARQKDLNAQEALRRFQRKEITLQEFRRIDSERKRAQEAVKKYGEVDIYERRVSILQSKEQRRKEGDLGQTRTSSQTGGETSTQTGTRAGYTATTPQRTRISDTVQINQRQYYINGTPVSPTQIYREGRETRLRQQYSNAQQFKQARKTNSPISIGEASFIDGSTGEVTDTGTRVGGQSVPYSTSAGVGREYTSYTTTPTQIQGASSQLRKATRRQKIQEKARSILYPNEPQIVRNGYVIREEAAGTPLNQQGGPLRNRPQLAQAIQSEQSTYYSPQFGRNAAKYQRAGTPVINLNTQTYAQTRPRRAEEFARGTAAGIVENPRMTIVKTGATYYAARAIGLGSGIGLTRGSLAVEAKYGLPTAIKAAKYANIGLTTAGLGLTAGYVATTPPQQIGRDLPQTIAFGAGFAKGLRASTKPALQEQGTVNEYLGIKDSLPKAKPQVIAEGNTLTTIKGNTRTTIIREGGTMAVGAEQQQTKVFEVFGRARTGKLTKQTFFSGKETTNDIFLGKLYSTRYAQIPTAKGAQTYTYGTTARGYGELNLNIGVATQTYPQNNIQAISVITQRQAFDTGAERTRGVTLIRTPRGAQTQEFTQYISPETTTELATYNTVRQTGTRAFPYEIGQPGATAQTTYFASGKTTPLKPARTNEANAIVELAGFKPQTGLPRSAVQQKEFTYLFNDPTLGLASSIITRSQQVPAQPTNIRQEKRTGLRGTPNIPAGIGTLPLRQEISTGSILLPLTSNQQTNTGVQRQQSFAQPQIQLLQPQQSFAQPQNRRNAFSNIIETQTSTRQGTQLLNATSLQQGTRTRGGGFIGLPLPPPPPPPPTPTPGLFGIPTFGIGSRERPYKTSKAREFSYAPNLAAGLFNITSPKETNIITGQEFRAVVKKRTTKTRKKKK